MDGDESFLAAIALNPRDDAARLIYADWLDEQGDRRANYLRVACAAAGRIREGRPWDDLLPALESGCEVILEEWRKWAGPWFDVILEAFESGRQITMVQLVREQTGVGLLEAKNLIMSAPVTLARRLPLERAEAMRRRLDRPFAGSTEADRLVCLATIRESEPGS